MFMGMGVPEAHEVWPRKSSRVIARTMDRATVIAREQRDRSNPIVLQDKYGEIAALPLVARNDTLLVIARSGATKQSQSSSGQVR